MQKISHMVEINVIPTLQHTVWKHIENLVYFQCKMIAYNEVKAIVWQIKFYCDNRVKRVKVKQNDEHAAIQPGFAAGKLNIQ